MGGRIPALPVLSGGNERHLAETYFYKLEFADLTRDKHGNTTP